MNVSSLKKLHVCTFILGYKYPEENLVAIARLRKNTLKKLEFAHADVIYSNSFSINAKKVIICSKIILILKPCFHQQQITKR